MRPHRTWLAAAGLSAAALAVYALNPPSASDGPIKLLACVVTPAGILEAAVDSSADHAVSCDFYCNYELAGRMFTHTFTATIPARFQGRVGDFDTNNASPGSYSGEVRRCQKIGR
jgi:hypothetical protein